jgi:hypothetical protein
MKRKHYTTTATAAWDCANHRGRVAAMSRNGVALCWECALEPAAFQARFRVLPSEFYGDQDTPAASGSRRVKRPAKDEPTSRGLFE